jgi:hypothetical protein
MIQIDLNAPSIPQSQRVWRLFPGSGYRFLESFRRQNVGYLDIPGFVFPRGRLSDATDLVARVAASQSIVGEINNGTTNSSIKPNLDEFSTARNTKFRGRFKQAIINFYEMAKLNDIVIMPEPKYMSKVWIGRFTQNITSEALYNLDNPNLTIAARRIEWLNSAKENSISSALSESLRNQHPFSMLEQSLFIEVFSLAYNSFEYQGRHVSTIFSGDDYLDSDSSLLGIISRLASATFYAVDQGVESKIVDILSVLISAPPLEYTSSQAIDIHSPGFIRYVSGKAVPLVIVAAVAALIALSEAPSKEALTEEIANMEVVNESPSADPQCAPPVQEATRRLLKAFDIDKTYQMCQEIREAQKRNTLRPSAIIKAKRP